MFLRSACSIGAAIALSFSLYSQTRPSNPTPTTPTSPNPGGGIGNTGRSTIPSTTTINPTNPTVERPIFLTGRVVLDDGTAPPEPVAIQRLCGANPHTETYTDGKGHFSFEWGQRLGVMPDASEDNFGRAPGMSNGGAIGTSGAPTSRSADQMMMGCELRAQLAGFRSDSIQLGNHRSLDNPEVGTIILHRVGNVQGVAISATTLMAPKDAKKAYEKGINDLKKDKPEEALKDFQKAVDVYPKFAAAWYELGRVQRGLKDLDGAKKSWTQALESDSKYVKPYIELAELYFNNQKWQEVKDTTDRLLALDAIDFPLAWYFSSVANYEMKDFDAAEKSAREGVKNDTSNTIPRMNQILGVLLANKADYAGAADSLRNYLKVAPNGPEAENVKKQLSVVEKRMQATATPEKENKQ